MDHETRAGQIRKLGAAPDLMPGSAQAVTEAGQLAAASGSGSQIGPHASDGQTVEDAAIVSQVTQRFDALGAEALPRGASRDMIRKVAEERWT